MRELRSLLAQAVVLSGGLLDLPEGLASQGVVATDLPHGIAPLQHFIETVERSPIQQVL